VNASSALEARYRRLLMLLPTAYRERRGEEMLGVLLDGATEGRRWPRAVEAASLAGLAVRLRTGAPGGSVRASAFGEVSQRLALAGLMIQALYYASVFGEFTAAGHPAWSGMNLLTTAMVLGEIALPTATLVCLVRGRSRAGRVLAVVGLGSVCVVFGASLAVDSSLVFLLPWVLLMSVAAPVTISLTATAAVLLGFHRDAPAAAAPSRWLRILAVSLPLVLACTAASQLLANQGSASAGWVAAAAHLIVSPIAPAVAVLFGLSGGRRPVVWSSGLLLVSVPVVALAVPAIVLLLEHMSLVILTRGGPAIMVGSMQDSAWEAIVTELILAVACWSAMRRHGRPAPSASPGLAGSA
jgi:hypothetical protein